MLVRNEVLTIEDYSPGMSIEEVKRRLDFQQVYKLASNENSLGPSKKALEAMRDSHDLHLYPEKNSPDLKRALGEHWGISWEQVVVGNGADDLILRIAQTFLNQGEVVVSATSTFSQYQFVTLLIGGLFRGVPLVHDTFSLKGILEGLDDSTKMIFICNPNNPTGTIIKEKELGAFLGQLPKNILVIIDEAYHEYVEDKEYPKTHLMLDTYPRLMILRTFSKVYGLAGIRVGYGLCHPQLVQYLEKSAPPFVVNRLAQKMALAALTDRSHLCQSQELIWEQKEYLYQELKKLHLQYVPTQGNFILIKTGFSAEEIFESLLCKGIVIRSGAIFGYPEAIRLTIGTFKENQAFLKAMEETLTEMRGKRS